MSDVFETEFPADRFPSGDEADIAGVTRADGLTEAELAEREDGDLWAEDPLAERARRGALRADLSNTDLGDVPPQWLDPATIGLASRAQAAADAGYPSEDTDGDGVTDAGELLDGTDPLDPTDVRTRGWTEDYDPALGGNPDLNLPAILDD